MFLLDNSLLKPLVEILQTLTRTNEVSFFEIQEL